MTAPKLKPCECGKTPKVTARWSSFWWRDQYFVVCDCGMDWGGYVTVRGVTNAWNRRAGEKKA